MNELLNVPNPDEKIKNIVKEAILQKQKEYQKVGAELENLSQQESSGIYYTPISMKTNSTLEFVAVAIVSILTDILHGMKEGAEYIKQDVDSIQKNSVGEKSQSGGGKRANNDKGTDKGTDKGNGIDNLSTASSIRQQADNMLKMIGGAINTAKNLTSAQARATTPPSNKSSGTEELSTSLGEQPPSLTGEAFSKAKDIGEAGIKTGIKLSGDALGSIIDYFMEITGGEAILETPLDKLNPELNKKVLLLAGILKEMSTNPATKQAIQEIAKAVAITMDEFIKDIREPVNEVATHAVEMMENVAEKFVTGITATGITVVQAFLAEIPWIGGIIDLFIAIGKGFNTLMSTYKVFISQSSPILITGAKTVKNTKNTIVNGTERIKNAASDSIENIQNAIQSVNGVGAEEPVAEEPVAEEPVAEEPIAEEPVAEPNPWVEKKKINGDSYWYNTTTRAIEETKPEWPPQVTTTTKVQSGGSINNRIMKGGKRLRTTMKLFHKTLPKLKFTCVNKPCKKNKTRKATKMKLTRRKNKRGV
jgi:hypothetical protein